MIGVEIVDPKGKANAMGALPGDRGIAEAIQVGVLCCVFLIFFVCLVAVLLFFIH